MIVCVCVWYCSTTFWPFLSCLAKVGPSMDPSTGETCATKNNMDWQKIDTCYKGAEGHT